MRLRGAGSTTVSKKKNAASLFEVISRSRQTRSEAGLSVPAWMGQPSEPDEAPHAQPVEGAPSVPDPTISTVEGRVKLSLNYVSLLVAGLAVLLGLLLAFCLGRWSASPGTVEATPAPALPSQRTERVPGKYYLIIQGLQGMTDNHRSDAEDIQRFLEQEGVECDVAIWPGDPKQYVVWSCRGLDSEIDEKAFAYVKKIEALGRKYKSQGGRYDFKQARDRNGQITPWFGQAPSP